MGNLIVHSLNDISNFSTLIKKFYPKSLSKTIKLTGSGFIELKINSDIFNKTNIEDFKLDDLDNYIELLHEQYKHYSERYVDQLEKNQTSYILDRHKASACLLLAIKQKPAFILKNKNKNKKVAPSVYLFNEFNAINVSVDVMLYEYNLESKNHRIQNVIYPKCTKSFTSYHKHSKDYRGFFATYLKSISIEATAGNRNGQKANSNNVGKTKNVYDSNRVQEIADKLYHIESYNRMCVKP